MERSRILVQNNEFEHACHDEFKASTKSPEWIEPLRAFEASKELLASTLLLARR